MVSRSGSNGLVDYLPNIIDDSDLRSLYFINFKKK